MLSTGPGRWLLLGTRDALDRAGSALPENIAACTDLSHGRTVLRLEGRGAPLLLSKGCPIDTHAKAFPTGSVAATGIERVPVLLARIDDRPSFELVLPRSYARAIFEWIMVSGHDLDLRAGLPLATA
jgi:sarcosine oxidase subunit gamma